MASHHYPHHHHHCTATSAAYFHGCCPPPAPSPEPYLPHYHHHFYNSPYPNAPIANPAPPPPTASAHSLHHQAPASGTHNERHFQQQQQPPPPPHHGQEMAESAKETTAVSSLLRRIAALESSLRDQSPRRARSLRDTAARTIQSHFRAFLVRRSRTLRQLKELASIKSTLIALKSSVSDSSRLNPIFVSHKASRLLFKLDLVQGCDPMIRDGKKSIGRELTRFLDLINGFTVKNDVISARVVKKNAVPRKADQIHGRRQCQDVGSSKMLEELANRVDALYDKLPKQGDDGVDKTAECHDIPTVKRILNSRSETEAKAGGKKSVRFADLVSMEDDEDEDEDTDNGEDEDTDNGEDEAKEDLIRNAEEVEGFSFVVTEDDEDDDGEGAIGYAVRREDGSLVFPAMDPRRKIVK